ncbi:MAG: aminotransferase class I/II-fold pyridoxal phosphate-dependent enzyme [Microthrixaceae bacterium]
MTVDQLEAARTPRTKALVFVSPSNPTGSVYPPRGDRGDRPVGRRARDRASSPTRSTSTSCTATHEHHSIQAVVPEIAEQCVILNGVAKTYAMTGWRVGWLIGPADVVKGATNLQTHLTSNVCNVAQRAALAAVSGDLSAVEEMRQVFDRRRRTMHRLLADIPGVSCMEPEGAFYAYPNLTGLLGVDLSGRSAASTVELADLVLEEAKVAFVPGEAFGSPGYGRFSFALGDDDLEEGIDRLARLVTGRA